MNNTITVRIPDDLLDPLAEVQDDIQMDCQEAGEPVPTLDQICVTALRAFVEQHIGRRTTAA